MSTVKTYLLPPSGGIPNNPRFPLLVYPGAFPVDAAPGDIEHRFHENEWGESWVNGVFDYHHFHSTSHEVLGCFRGRATLQFGGEAGPEIDLSAGDVVVIPAGVGHKNLGSTPDFGVVGAYPPGPSHDLCRGDEDPDRMKENIAGVSLPPADPVFGKEGGLWEHWAE